MSTAPLDGARRVKRPGDTLRGLASGLLVLGIVAGIPAALVLVVGNPIPEIQRDPVGGQVPVEFVLDVIVCIVWLAWAQLVSCVVTELVAGVRGSGLPWRVPFAAAAQQDFARRLVTAVLLLATAGHGLQSAHAPAGPASAAPAAVASVSAAVNQVGATSVGQADAAARQAGAARVAPASDRAGALHGVKQYVVMPPQGRHHDSLWDVSERYLGSGIRYREVFELNKGRIQPDGSRLTLESLIRPGWTLVLPADAHGEGLIEVTPELSAPVDGSVAAHASGTAGSGEPAGSGPAGSGGLSGAGSVNGAGGPAGSGTVAGAGPSVGSGPISGSGTGTGPGSGTQGPLARVATDGRPQAGVEQAPTRSPEIPWDLVGAELLAAGVLEALIVLRRRRADQRRPGTAVPLPDAEAVAAEVAVRLGADAAGADYLDRALRTLVRALAERDRQIPEVYAARLSAEALELLLAVPLDQAPLPFVAENGGARWVLDRSTVLPPVDGVPAPLPGLVSVGGDGSGRIFVDLESAGGAICVAGDLDRARSVVAAAAVELVTNRWSDEMRVTLVGFGSALAPLNSDRLRCVDTLDEVIVEGVTDRLSTGRQVLAASGIDSVLTGRVRGLRGDGLTPDFLVLASPPAPEQLAELQEWARSARRAPLGVLVAGDVPGARWRFEIDDKGMLDTGVLGVTVGAQLLTARSYAALARLLRAEAAAAEPAPAVPAPAWAPLSAVPAEVEPLTVPALPRPVDPDGEPAVLLRIFGEPAVDGTDRLLPGTPLALEIAGFLALTGGVTPRALAASVWPYGVTVAERDATLARVGDWLGTDATGEPRLRLAEDGRLRLSGDVQLDWHVFVALAARGGDEDVLRALELARGPLVEPHLPRRYTWIARDAVSREMPAFVADVAHRASAGYRAAGRLDGAIAAARAGLRVEPASGPLWADLVAGVRERDGEAAATRTLADQAAAVGAALPDPQGSRATRLTA